MAKKKRERIFMYTRDEKGELIWPGAPFHFLDSKDRLTFKDGDENTELYWRIQFALKLDPRFAKNSVDGTRADKGILDLIRALDPEMPLTSEQFEIARQFKTIIFEKSFHQDNHDTAKYLAAIDFFDRFCPEIDPSPSRQSAYCLYDSFMV